MSQTPTQRRREIDDARRRNINSTIVAMANVHPERRHLADQLSVALGVLSGDELEIGERLTTAIHLVWLRDGNRTIGAKDVLLSISAVVSRLLRGRASYGELTMRSDPRDWALERDEELADAIVYDAIAAVELERVVGDPDPLRLVSDHFNALSNVGAHVQHSTLAARIQSVLDRERPEPFVIPAPWCLGSALLFQLLAVRIENNTAVAVRCHQCGREWSLADQELRLSGSGQYVIPTHKPDLVDWTTLPPVEPPR